MKKNHAYRLRPYHNPENIDESLVPDGWRFRYADEITYHARICRLWRPHRGDFTSLMAGGTALFWTYIVPVNS